MTLLLSPPLLSVVGSVAVSVLSLLLFWYCVFRWLAVASSAVTDVSSVGGRPCFVLFVDEVVSPSLFLQRSRF